MKHYNKSEWEVFRDEVIELDGGACRECNRSRKDGVVLQVHHKSYINGKAPWEYPYDMCETLCKGCHAAEHGIILPKKGWAYAGSHDLDDLCGTCELCGSAIRYVFYVTHPKWLTLEVGTVCCDNLTETKTASALRRKEDRKLSFLSSPRWKKKDNTINIKQKGVEISILEDQSCFRIVMGNIQGKFSYTTLDEAKEKIFEFIDSGAADEFFKKRKKS